MKIGISISDFRFTPNGYGSYIVKYTSPITDKHWICSTNDMPLIDNTKNAAYPKIKDLEILKRRCKA